MKTFQALLNIASLVLLVSLLYQIHSFISKEMVKKSQMVLCYNAGDNGYLWPIIEYRCTLVPRGKGW